MLTTVRTYISHIFLENRLIQSWIPLAVGEMWTAHFPADLFLTHGTRLCFSSPVYGPDKLSAFALGCMGTGSLVGSSLKDRNQSC